ncbi:hypothetical protein LP420_16590 [Massilia sp. B-10]|nr:hypothetical protein LP420_16590 [Massilia sp. B-10]
MRTGELPTPIRPTPVGHLGHDAYATGTVCTFWSTRHWAWASWARGRDFFSAAATWSLRAPPRAVRRRAAACSTRARSALTAALLWSSRAR